MSAESEKVNKALERFRAYRKGQSGKLAEMQKLADEIEAEVQSIVSNAGTDPINSQPILRLSKQMPDYATAWGINISPLGAAAANLTLDRTGRFMLALGGPPMLIEVQRNSNGTVVGGLPTDKRMRPVSDIIMGFLADQLNHVVDTNVII